MKQNHIITKTIFQIALYLIEVLTSSLILTYLTTFLAPITSSIIFLERMILSYTIYQILVIVVLTNLNDTQRDSYLAWITTLKMTLLYIETGDKNTRLILDKNIQYQLNQSTFNSISLRKCYTQLEQNLDNINEVSINLELIIAEQQYELHALNWKFSFILRSQLFK